MRTLVRCFDVASFMRTLPHSQALAAAIALLAVSRAFAQSPEPAIDAGVSAEDQALLKEMEAATQPKSPPPPPPPSLPARAASFFSNTFNPALSLNGLLLASATNDRAPAPADPKTGLAIQEVELQFLTNVDPYFSANLLLSLPGGRGIEVEEGYLVVTPQPYGLSFRAGKIKAPFGRENAIHTHALPFVDKSLVGTAVFGEEGLNEVSVEGSYLVPLPFYTLLTVTAMNGDNEALFASAHGEDLAGFGNLKSVLDLSDDATLEAGASYALGKNSASLLSQAAGAHLVFKWKPARAYTTRSLVVAVEGMLASRPTGMDEAAPPTPPHTSGFYGYAQWQLAQRWYVTGRFDYLRTSTVGAPVDETLRESAILVFAPTEFSALRLQASLTHPPGGGDPVIAGVLQANFTLGAHPAHAY